MATKKVTDLLVLTAGQVDRATDVIEISDVSASQSKKVTPNALMNISGNAVGDTDSQTLSNKTLTSPTINGATLSGTLSGTYTIGGTPTFPSSVATLTGSQTLTNKILTSPTINTATIVNPTITADSIAGFSASTTGTIFGLSVSSGAISGASLTAATVSNSKLTSTAVNSTVVDWATTGQVWWQELTRTTLGSSASTMTATFSAKNYLDVRFNMIITGGSAFTAVRFNGDTGANYTFRYLADGATGTSVSQTSVGTLGGSADLVNGTMFISNIATSRKAGRLLTSSAASAASANAGFTDFSFTWSNTASAITSVTVFVASGAGSLATGSEVVVLGHN